MSIRAEFRGKQSHEVEPWWAEELHACGVKSQESNLVIIYLVSFLELSWEGGLCVSQSHRYFVVFSLQRNNIQSIIIIITKFYRAHISTNVLRALLQRKKGKKKKKSLWYDYGCTMVQIFSWVERWKVWGGAELNGSFNNEFNSSRSNFIKLLSTKICLIFPWWKQDYQPNFHLLHTACYWYSAVVCLSWKPREHLAGNAVFIKAKISC